MSSGSMPAWAPSLLVVFAVGQLAQSCQHGPKSAEAKPRPKTVTEAKAEPAPAPALTVTRPGERGLSAPSQAPKT